VAEDLYCATFVAFLDWEYLFCGEVVLHLGVELLGDGAFLSATALPYLFYHLGLLLYEHLAELL
jgi:hypothetical protein